MVLAERASQVTAIAPHGQNAATRHESPQRLFLNGIERQCCNPAVIGGGHFAAGADPGAAKAELAFFQFTMSEADFTSWHALPSVLSNELWRRLCADARLRQ